MKTKLKTSIVLAALLLTACFISLAEPQKTEIVYAKLDNAGKTSGVYIVNLFESDEAATLKDYGDYEKTVNLSHMDAVSLKGDEVAFSMEPGRFLYQGNLKDKALPWDIKIDYALDGKAVSPEELSGAKGELNIKLGIRPNEGFESFTGNMLLQGTLSFPIESVFSIEAQGAVKAYAGTNITLSYVVLPGMEAEYAINAQVKDFSMPPIQIAGLKMSMDNEMLGKYLSKTLEDSPFQQVAKNMVNSMLGADIKPISFADKRNGEISSLQFVFMTEGIAEKPKPKVETQKEADKSIWDKIADLF
ncbi:MAG: hypothetical protein ACOYIT_00910 [Christensenellales bacterium]|jgi:hypothetical protein